MFWYYGRRPKRSRLLCKRSGGVGFSGQNYYERLGVSVSATGPEIDHAYRQLALRLHPDRRSPTSRERAQTDFKLVNEAAAILRDPTRRQTYDRAAFKPLNQSTIYAPYEEKLLRLLAPHTLVSDDASLARVKARIRERKLDCAMCHTTAVDIVNLLTGTNEDFYGRYELRKYSANETTESNLPPVKSGNEYVGDVRDFLAKKGGKYVRPVAQQLFASKGKHLVFFVSTDGGFGDHSYAIEKFGNGRCRVYQSFQGAFSLNQWLNMAPWMNVSDDNWENWDDETRQTFHTQFESFGSGRLVTPTAVRWFIESFHPTKSKKSPLYVYVLPFRPS